MLCVCICTSYYMATKVPANLVPIPPFLLTKWPQKGLSGIFGPISRFSPFHIIMANSKTGAWDLYSPTGSLDILDKDPWQQLHSED